MKNLRYVWLIAISILALFAQCEKEPEPEPENLIPDIHFLNALIQKGVDTDGDRLISPEEAAAVDVLDVSYCSISNMKGIELFVNLTDLNCSENFLTTLDISKNTSLGLGLGSVYLYCYLEIEDMPTLEEVCVWRLPFPPEGLRIDTTGSPNIYFTTECSRWVISPGFHVSGQPLY